MPAVPGAASGRGLRAPGAPPCHGTILRAARRGIAAPQGTVDSVEPMRDRLCSKVGCAREAITTLTYDYNDQMAAIGPLGAAADPHAHDLCAIHTDRLSVPKGWVVVRHETLRL
ncbi:hypothetical protein GCM10009777_18880 [Microbacterium pumilum]|uniref:Alcohol dehydrogenase n=2 Tax=Microbacterium pumilum TaxID=344165 RepID=A0ABN2SE41_9MICO